MRALIVYESMFGNSRQIAESIQEGISTVASSATLVNVNHVGPTELRNADILIVGGPTHVHGMSRASTRTAARDQVTAELPLEADAPGSGVRDFLGALAGDALLGAAFDTRLDRPEWFTGAASRGIAKLLKSHRVRLIAKPESFLVDRSTRLNPGELERAVRWGESLGVAARMAREERSGRHV